MTDEESLLRRALQLTTALDNCLMYASRQKRSHSDEAGRWDQIIRFCNEVGVRHDPLRAEIRSSAQREVK
jgi:hypothetical protein